jgi:hypothetical protein
MKVTEEYRGWAGHCCCADLCRFRLNTLLSREDGLRIVVSTVGNMVKPGSRKPIEIGYQRYYETMAFYSQESDSRYHDANVAEEVPFDSEWSICKDDADNEANEMHSAVVQELKVKMEKGEL